MKPRSLFPILLALSFVSCSSGPEPPAKGTPAFSWGAAKESYAAGDYAKTADHLAKVTGADNEFRTLALPWRLVLLAGLSNGNAELADQYEIGARVNKANPAPFRKTTSALRSDASRFALEFAETFAQFQKLQPSGDVKIDFPYPPVGSAKQIASRVNEGVLPEQSGGDTLRTQYVQRGVLQAASHAFGGDDVTKAPPTVPRDVFLRAMAANLNDQAGLFSHMKLDMPDREKLLKERAMAALEGLPDSKELKTLRAKIQEAGKKK